MNTWTIQRTGRAAGAMFGIAVVSALMLATARQAGAQEQEQQSDLGECTEAAWAEYNGCLMTSNCWMEQIHCDWSFEFQMFECAIDEIGDIKGAYTQV